MIDFSRLRVLASAEQEAKEKKRIVQDVADDLARREDRSRKSLVLRLTSDAELRHAMSGARIVHLPGDDERGRPTAAHRYAPEHFGADAVNTLFDWLVDGAVRIKARLVAGVKRFEFVAQFFAVGDGPSTP